MKLKLDRDAFKLMLLKRRVSEHSMCKEAGITPQNFCRIKRVDANVRMSTASKICSALSCDLVDIFFVLD